MASAAERAQSLSAAAQARGKITEIELQIIQIDQDLSSEVARELREVDMKIGEFVEPRTVCAYSHRTSRQGRCAMTATTTDNREHNNRELTDTELLGVVAGAVGVKTISWSYDDESPKREPIRVGP